MEDFMDSLVRQVEGKMNPVPSEMPDEAADDAHSSFKLVTKMPRQSLSEASGEPASIRQAPPKYTDYITMPLAEYLPEQ